MSQKTIEVSPLDPTLFTGMQRLLAGPARTGNITVDVPYGTLGRAEYARWIYVGTTGNLSYVKWDGTTQVLNAITAGIWHPIYSIMVNSSGTSASNLVWGS
jgi:hypothetical protein